MKILLIILMCCLPFIGTAQDCTVDIFEAHTIVGEEATVCGTVSEVYHSIYARGKPYYINMGHPYPNQAFTLVVWVSDLKKFDYYLKELEGKQLAVTGPIEQYRGKPQIIVKNPTQIKVIE